MYAHRNVVGTSNILEMARLFGCRSLVMASSSSIYGDNQTASSTKDAGGDDDALAVDRELVHEFRRTDVVVHPVSVYAATKVGCDLLTHTSTRCTGCRSPACGSSRYTAPGAAPTWPAEVHGPDLPGPKDRPMQERQRTQKM